MLAPNLFTSRPAALIALFKTVIEVDTKLRESPIAGVPITQYRPAARGSQQYRELAQELIEYVKEKDQQAA